jgi:hypothetical protein
LNENIINHPILIHYIHLTFEMRMVVDFALLWNILVLLCHSTQFQCLCLMKSSKETLSYLTNNLAPCSRFAIYLRAVVVRELNILLYYIE